MAKANFQKGAKVERWEKAIDNPSGALTKIGALMVAESQRAFREQKHGRKAWKARAPVNVYGIIADFTKGSTPPRRRFETRPVLHDTGRLARSVAFKVSGNFVEVGTNLDYASVHNFGGPIESQPITKAVQEALNKWLKPKDKGLKKSLGWLLNKKYTGETLTGEVSARRFVGITKSTIEDVREAIGIEIMEVK